MIDLSHQYVLRLTIISFHIGHHVIPLPSHQKLFAPHTFQHQIHSQSLSLPFVATKSSLIIGLSPTHIPPPDLQPIPTTPYRHHKVVTHTQYSSRSHFTTGSTTHPYHSPLSFHFHGSFSSSILSYAITGTTTPPFRCPLSSQYHRLSSSSVS